MASGSWAGRILKSVCLQKCSLPLGPTHCSAYGATHLVENTRFWGDWLPVVPSLTQSTAVGQLAHGVRMALVHWAGNHIMEALSVTHPRPQAGASLSTSYVCWLGSVVASDLVGRHLILKCWPFPAYRLMSAGQGLGDISQGLVTAALRL